MFDFAALFSWAGVVGALMVVAGLIYFVVNRKESFRTWGLSWAASGLLFLTLTHYSALLQAVPASLMVFVQIVLVLGASALAGNGYFKSVKNGEARSWEVLLVSGLWIGSVVMALRLILGEAQLGAFWIGLMTVWSLVPVVATALIPVIRHWLAAGEKAPEAATRP